MFYMCDNESTSDEHAPARGFFPADMRKSLIKVPACKLHNEDTSIDDEYVRNYVTMCIANNETAINQFMKKSLKSFNRSPGLLHTVIRSLSDAPNFAPGAKALQLDRTRLDRTMRKIAYALFYNEYKATWKRLLAVTTNQIKMADLSNDHLSETFEFLSSDMSTVVLKGDNPQAFQYGFVDFGDDPFDKALFFLFYEGFPFWIVPMRDTTENSLD